MLTPNQQARISRVQTLMARAHSAGLGQLAEKIQIQRIRSEEDLEWAESIVARALATNAFPVTLALTEWVREYPVFTGVEHWFGTASAGPSGSRNLYHGANSPATGAPLNGFRTASFDGAFQSTNSQEGSNNHLDTILTPAAWSCWALIFATVAVPASPDPRNDPALFDDAGGTFWQINYNANGVNLTQVDNVGTKLVTRACPINGWHLVQAKYDGVNIAMRVDSGAYATLAAGSINNSLATLYLRIGDNFAGLHWTGRIAEVGTAQVAFSNATFDQIKSYINGRYALAL